VADSVHQELMIIGGRHTFEDCTIRAAGPLAVRLAISRPGPGRPAALREIQLSGKDSDAKPQYTFRGCTIESTGATPSEFVIGPNVNVTIENCTCRGIRFKVDPAASIRVNGSTLDRQPLKLSR
jgi:hypothetical protein